MNRIFRAKKNNGETIDINFVIFDNNIVVVNVNPDPVNMQNLTGENVQVPVSAVVHSHLSMSEISSILVEKDYVGDTEGWEIVKMIEAIFHYEFSQNSGYDLLIIIGNIFTAQAYPGRIFDTLPVSGYENSSEKLMRCDKFVPYNLHEYNITFTSDIKKPDYVEI